METDSCRQFLCAQYDERANLTDSVSAASARATLETPAPPTVATTPMPDMAGAREDAVAAQDAVVSEAGPNGGVAHPLRRTKDRKRKKVVKDSTAS